MILSKRSFNILFALFITSILPSPYLLYEQTPSTVPIAKNNSTLTNISVIPYPEFIDKKNSTVTISNGFRIISKQNLTEDLQLALHRYSKYISLLTGISVTINQTFLSPRNKLIIDCPSIISKIDKYPKLGEDESYKLNITKTGSYLYSLSLTGIIRGLSTFVQLIEQHESSNTFYIPLVNIIDRPRFMWRGLLLDVSRHWMPVPVIERTLNTMELSKFNVLHLHLSDDQGFRVESIKYNLLHDRKDFFTQKDIKYLVEYARQRRIRIIPEFDIPGHTTSWFVGYPELASQSGPYQLATRWGVMKPTMDPTKENTYIFLDKFFREMTKLFPDPYFHIGGDEVEGSQWTQSPTIQQFINEHNLKNNHGLQAYFNKRIQKLLKKYGKIMIGWEEILDEIHENQTIDKDVVIQTWLRQQATANAVKNGYQVIVSNGYYLNRLLSSINYYKVDPILRNNLYLPREQQQNNILGGEACVWSEYIAANSVDSRIWPHALAIAERLWSPSSITNENFLYERLFRMNHLFDKMQTGVTHISLYKSQLQNFILDPKKKLDLLQPLIILADVCEPCGPQERSKIYTYSANTPLTTFTDVLQSESELIWKLGKLPINDELSYRDIFQTWSINHLHLRELFDNVEKTKNQKIWGQDIEQLSLNLANTGQIGLRILDYNSKKILNSDKNNTMNSWTLSYWICYHKTLLRQLENQVKEVRLAAVRPVLRLLNSIQIIP
ncbi:unnamed protein product [Rotaria sordida]|uniref:beta-N-acetylhexosaminidase n=1 Tax=Rotaria sordida TaxID=392033 RepID=A0A816A8B1_9BILA|nr:unnamed protein product [Rotaria sordida]CAF1594294.1 unnamed protein product [Rotaria sordida]